MSANCPPLLAASELGPRKWEVARTAEGRRQVFIRWRRVWSDTDMGGGSSREVERRRPATTICVVDADDEDCGR